MAEYAENLPYWKSGQSDPQKWLDKAATEIERAGGTVLSEGYGTHAGTAAYMLRFKLDGDAFRVVWPVVESKYQGNDRDRAFLAAARRQAATMMYHDVKAACVKARVMGARAAFFAHLELPDGRVASELSGAEVTRFPLMLTGGDVIDGEVSD